MPDGTKSVPIGQDPEFTLLPQGRFQLSCGLPGPSFLSMRQRQKLRKRLGLSWRQGSGPSNSLHTAVPLPSPADTRAALCSSYQDAGELMALVAG